jgi:hypothetical protein
MMPATPVGGGEPVLVWVNGLHSKVCKEAEPIPLSLKFGLERENSLGYLDKTELEQSDAYYLLAFRGSQEEKYLINKDDAKTIEEVTRWRICSSATEYEVGLYSSASGRSLPDSERNGRMDASARRNIESECPRQTAALGRLLQMQE